MHGSKLLEVLSIFSSKELLQFRGFLQSPFFLQTRKNEDHLALLERIIDCHPNFEDPKLCKEQTFEAIFQSKVIQKGKLEKVMSSLLKQTYRFISYQSILQEEDDISFQLRQSRFFRDRGMEKFYRRAINQLQRSQENSDNLNQEYYFNQYLIEKEQSDFAALHNSRREKLNIPNTLQSLDVYYFVTKLEYSCWLLSQNQNLTSQNQQESLSLLEEMLNNLDQRSFLEIPLIQAYIYAFQMLLGKKEDMFKQLKNYLMEKEEKIPLEQLKALQTLCRNYSIVSYNKGEGDWYLEEAFDLYQRHLKKGYLHYEGGLLPATIKNLMRLSLKLQKYEWGYDFLQNAKEKIIGTKYPNDVYSFNLAWYYFSLKEYDKALASLTDTYEDVYYKVAAKRLEIQIRFAQNSPLTVSRLDAFKIYLFRISKKSLSDLQREGNNNFVDLLKQILNPKTKNNTTRIQKLIEKIKEKKIIVEKDWLLEVLTEMAVS